MKRHPMFRALTLPAENRYLDCPICENEMEINDRFDLRGNSRWSHCDCCNAGFIFNRTGMVHDFDFVDWCHDVPVGVLCVIAPQRDKP